MRPLSTAEQRAIAAVSARAALARPAANEYLKSHIESVSPVVARVASEARVTLNFHPDRLIGAGDLTVAEGLLRDGIYQSQFKTGVSNGSATAFAGGDRDIWEERLFDGAYQQAGVTPEERPKYGALDLMGYADGGSPRFGSCYFRLRPEVTERCTFTWGDSHAGPEHLGTTEVFEPILAALFREVESRGEALGHPMNLTDLQTLLAASPGASGAVGRALDDYIEAQIHGPIHLAEDIALLVADASFRGDPTLEAIARRYAIPLEYHPGFQLPVEDVPAEFRGPEIPPLARRIDAEFHGGGVVRAPLLGAAARSARRFPERWGLDALQHIKQLWHVLVRFGQPVT
jgi:hypothetical protein